MLIGGLYNKVEVKVTALENVYGVCWFTFTAMENLCYQMFTNVRN